MKKGNRALAVLLSLVITLSYMPALAFAGTEDGADPNSNATVETGQEVENEDQTSTGGGDTANDVEESNVQEEQAESNTPTANQQEEEPVLLGAESNESDVPEETGEVSAVAKIGETTYVSLKEAVDAANVAETATTITMLDDATVAETITLNPSKRVTLDLAGHKVTANLEKLIPLFKLEKGALTVKNSVADKGGISGSGIIFRIDSRDSGVSSVSGAAVTINKGVSVTSSDSPCVMIRGYANLTVNGSLASSGQYATIQGNGSDSQGSKITITGSVKSNGSNAIYHPQTGTLTVNEGANIEGVSSGIAIKAGTLNINGGIIKATGDFAIPTEGWNDGINASGCAVQIESNSGYNANGVSVSIKGGALESKNAAAVYEYIGNGDSTYLKSMKVTGGTFKAAEGIDAIRLSSNAINSKVAAVSGGSFSSVIPAALCAPGYKPSETPDENGMYGTEVAEESGVASITKNGKTTHYMTLSAAVSAAESGDEVVLTKDVTVNNNNSPAINLRTQKNVTLNLNGHSLEQQSGKQAAIKVLGSTGAAPKLIIKGEGAIKGAFKALIVGPHAEVSIEEGVNINGNSYGVSVDGGQVVVTSEGNISGSEAGVFIDGAGKNKVVNINGGSVTGQYGVYSKQGATVNVSDGAISGTTAAVALNGYQAYSSDSEYTIKLNVHGGAITGVDDAWAIAGNGEADNGNYEINISNGTITSDSCAIYHCNDGVLNVTGGSITGETAIYQKAGTMSISGGTITGNGEKKGYTYNGNGANATGDAIVVDNCGYPGGVPAPAISGGTINSTNADPIGSYAYTAEGQETKEPVGGFVTGGTFSSEIAQDVCGEGFVCEKNEDGTYGVVTLKPIQWFNSWSASNAYYTDEDNIPAATTQCSTPKIKREGESKYHAAEDFVKISWKVTDVSATSADGEASTIATVDDNGLITFAAPGSVKVWLTMTDAAGTKTASKEVSYVLAPVYIERDGAKVAYATLYAAFNKAQNGETIVLNKDATFANIGKMTLSNGNAITVDLNGHNIAMAQNYRADSFGAIFTVKKGNLTIVDSVGGGKVEASGTNCRAFNLDGKKNSSANDAKLVISEGVSVSSADDCCVTVFGKATLETSGDLSSPADFAIAGNGSAGEGGYVIEVKGGSVTGDEVAIYHPNEGTLTVSGGSITGDTGIYQKAGTLNITGGTITGNGEKKDYTYNGNGANATGDAVVIDNCGYPGNDPVPAITGGTFNSTNAAPIASYVGNNIPEADKVAGFVSDGTFSGEVPEELCAEGLRTRENEDGTYGVVEIVQDEKEKAIKEIDAVDFTKYSGEDLNNVLAAIDTARKAVNAAETTSDIESAMKTFNDTIAECKTDEQKESQALADAKKAAKDKIDSYKAEDYSGADKTAVEAAIAKANKAVDDATTIEEVNAALVTAMDEIAACTTDAQKLANAKTNANAQLDAFDKTGFSEADAAKVEKAIIDAKTAIEKATTVDAVNEALTKANTDIAKIKADAAEEAGELAGAKKLAKAQIEAIDSSKYSEPEKNEVEAAKNKALEAIEKATSVDGIQSALTEANNTIASKKTNEQKVADAKDAALKKLDEIDKSQYSGDELVAVEQAIADAKATIESATSVEDVNKAVTTAENKVKEQKTDAEKAEEATKKDADKKLQEAKDAAKDAQTAAETAEASKTAAEAAAKTPGQAAVDAAQKALDDANAAKKVADEAKAKAEAAKTAAEAAYGADSDQAKEAQNLVDNATTAANNAATAVTNAQSAVTNAKNAKAAVDRAAAANKEIQDLPVVKITKPKAKKKKAVVRWKKVSKKNKKKIQGIQIQVAKDPGFKSIVKNTTAKKTKKSKTIKGLKSKTRYWVRIRAYKNVGSVRHVSAWKVKKVKVK